MGSSDGRIPRDEHAVSLGEPSTVVLERVVMPTFHLHLTATDMREHIIQTAQILFAQFGLRNVTTDDIAKESRVSKAAIHEHFEDRSEIFDLLVQREADGLLEALEEAVARSDTAEDRLRAHLRTHLEWVSDSASFFRVTQESWGDYWPHVARVRKEFLAREQAIVARIVRDGVTEGELHVDDPERVALVWILALTSLEYQWPLEEGDFTLSEFVDLMLRMLFDGIRRR